MENSTTAFVRSGRRKGSEDSLMLESSIYQQTDINSRDCGNAAFTIRSNRKSIQNVSSSSGGFSICELSYRTESLHTFRFYWRSIKVFNQEHYSTLSAINISSCSCAKLKHSSTHVIKLFGGTFLNWVTLMPKLCNKYQDLCVPNLIKNCCNGINFN